MYWSDVRVNGNFSDNFLVQAGFYLDFGLSPVLFIIMLNAQSKKIRSGYPEELLYFGKLVLVNEVLERSLESKGLRILLGKKKR